MMKGILGQVKEEDEGWDWEEKGKKTKGKLGQ
jgi:hypothetical protein